MLRDARIVTRLVGCFESSIKLVGNRFHGRLQVRGKGSMPLLVSGMLNKMFPRAKYVIEHGWELMVCAGFGWGVCWGQDGEGWGINMWWAQK